MSRTRLKIKHFFIHLKKYLFFSHYGDFVITLRCRRGVSKPINIIGLPNNFLIGRNGLNKYVIIAMIKQLMHGRFITRIYYEENDRFYLENYKALGLTDYEDYIDEGDDYPF